MASPDDETETCDFPSFVQKTRNQDGHNGYRSSRMVDLSSSGDSDSSSDEDNFSWKKKRARNESSVAPRSNTNLQVQPPKICSPSKAKRQARLSGQQKSRHVNNIWGSIIQEQSVTDILSGKVDLSRGRGDDDDDDDDELEEDRDVESYNYKMKEHDTRLDTFRDYDAAPNDDPLFDDIHSHIDQDVMLRNNPLKRKRHHNRKSAKERLGERTYDKNKARPHIKVTEEDAESAIVDTLVELLCEPKADLMKRVVETLGTRKSLELLYMTEDVEEAGGLMTMNGRRRRTPGGVYIQLMKSDPDITKDQINDIFQEERKQQMRKHKEIRKKKQKRMLQQAADEVMDCQREAEMQIGEDAASVEKPAATVDVADKMDSEQNVKAQTEQRDSDLEEGEILEDGEILD